MRHLFLIHSPITRLVSHAVIAAEGIDRTDALFLLHRGATADRSVASIPFPESMPADRRGLLWPRLRAFDRRLRELVDGAPFHFYTPHTRGKIIGLVASHPLCDGFSLIEEGLSAYLTPQQLERVSPTRPSRLRERIRSRGRLGTRRYYDPRHERAYAVDRAAFASMERRTILPEVFPTTLDPELDRSLGPTEVVLVFDGLSRRGHVSLAAVLHAVGRVLDRLAAEGVPRVHTKLHPAQLGTDEVAPIEALLADRSAMVEVARLPDDLSLEALAHARPGTRFVVNVSSTALYAAAAGCRVESYARWIAEAEPGYQRVIEELPRVFRERVSFLG